MPYTDIISSDMSSCFDSRVSSESESLDDDDDDDEDDDSDDSTIVAVCGV